MSPAIKKRLKRFSLSLLLLLLIATPLAFSEQSAGLRFSEIMTRNTQTLLLGDDFTPDWFSLENTSTESLSLNGCVVYRADKPEKAFVFTGGVLEPGERIVLYADGEASTANGELHTNFKLSSSGVTLELLNASGILIDRVEVPALKKDELYSRDQAGEWHRSSSSAGAIAEEEGEIISWLSDLPLPQDMSESVQITEVLSSNATYPLREGLYDDYVELLNTTEESISLEGWYLSDTLANLVKWQFPALTLAPGERTVIMCSGKETETDSSEPQASFRLSRDGGTMILSDTGCQPVSAVSFPALESDQAYSLTENGWTKDLRPTPGLANTEENAVIAHEEIRKYNTTGLLITEIAASVSGAEDWIELHNEGAQAVDLSGYWLSDDVRHPRIWQFPQGTVLQPDAYLIVYASGASANETEGLHAGFKLSADGEEAVALSDPRGAIIDRLFLGKQYKNLTYGRTSGEKALRYFTTPSPGAKNPDSGYLGWAQPPQYSLSGGLYTSGQNLQVALTAPTGSRIYYTLDNTDPGEGATLYTAPLSITSTTILRTRVYRDGYIPSYMDSQSYLFDVNNGDGTVFVMSMVSDPDNLTGSERGIMNHSSEQWEREGHIEIFNPDGSTLVSQECGIKLHGEGSRVLDEKSFTIVARNSYGDNRFRAAIFSRRPYTEYQSFLLRPSSEDSVMTRMRDAVLQSLVQDSSLMYQEVEVGVLYIDGVYWGHYNLRERINSASICQFEGWEGQEDDIDLIKGNTQVMQGSDSTMKELLAYVKKADMKSDEAYQRLDSAIDIQNYIEYMCIEIFTGNTDTLNVKRYRNANADGKWRWALFDLDWGFYNDTNSVTRWLKPGGAGHNQATDNTLYIACMKNPVFRDRLLTYLGEQMATTYASENVIARIEAFYEVIKPLLPDTFARWNLTQENYDHYMRKFVNYAKTRPTRMLQFLKYDSTLNLSESDMERYFGDAMRVAGVTYAELGKP